MQVTETADSLSKALDADRAAGRRVGLVPTMGALHEGHLSLVEAARRDVEVVVVSTFVNPLQFDDPADLARYPRNLEHDAARCAEAGVDYLFAPATDELHPAPVLTSVRVAGLGEVLEGASRPGHFAGVATVVTKLLALTGRCRAYFGEKDYQQLVVVRRLVTELRFPVEVVGCTTVRQPDGVAVSSRNVLLSEAERAAAPVLYRALLAGRDLLETGERRPDRLGAAMARVVAAEPLASLDYAAAVDASDLRAPERLSGEVRLLVAAWLGTTRLIDNLGARA
ncbi:MAG: pantoate--beta-alanine ligase [Acidimicrobiales bacterium]|nr:pantoate--beta-alanine ligase [Acidimicrobiales bacterium]MBO0893876.1 pantoate--beta-alanine ligase [Acidimicrobiales bacterium]